VALERLNTLMQMPKTLVMGILNVTPDSFSDGGTFFQEGCVDVVAVVSRAEALLAAGADIIDIGGESTRPGAVAVDTEEEMRRVIPVIQAIHQCLPQAIMSIDTRKSSVAREAVAVGAVMINDVSGLQFDPQMGAVIAETGVFGVMMHSQGTPDVMQQAPTYSDVVDEVAAFLTAQAKRLQTMGVASEKIILDPGFGFGKTLDHNLALLRHLNRFTALGHPVLLGTSRKSFLTMGHTTIAPQERDVLTAATTALGIHAGVKIIRVHDVAQQALVAQLLDAAVR